MEIICNNCEWSWSTKDSEEFDKYVCHKCGNDMTEKYTLNKLIKKTLRENFDLAVKSHVKTNQLSSEEMEKVLSVTNKDGYTKAVSDYLFRLKNHKDYIVRDMLSLSDYYTLLKTYNKNVLPIKGFDLNNLTNDVGTTLSKRIETIEQLKKLPSKAIRNLKGDIRVERNYVELRRLKDDLEYAISMLSQLDNRDEEAKNKILNKVFKNNLTFQEFFSFLDDKESLIGGKDFTKDVLEELMDEHRGDIEITYENSKALVLSVYSAEAIKDIGCNSLWCFTYGRDNYRMWSEYSYNGMVYIIIIKGLNSDDTEFMNVLIKPFLPEDFEGGLKDFRKAREDNDELDEYNPLFDMTNTPIFSFELFLLEYFKEEELNKIFTFDY